MEAAEYVFFVMGVAHFEWIQTLLENTLFILMAVVFVYCLLFQ